MPTPAKTGACYTGLIGATVLAVVRTISGFALAPRFSIISNIMIASWISKGLREFLDKVIILKSLEMTTQIAVRRAMPYKSFLEKD